jgi:GTP-binding protein
VIRFADEAFIEVRSGKGGNGCISFRREKYVPKGGPAGGDGGRGGDVVFFLKRNLRTLSHLRYKRVFKAQNGGDGEGGSRHGRDGDDILIPLPPGSTLKDPSTGEILCDFGPNESGDARFVFLKGGNGGWGNVHFKSSTNQAPRRANQGLPGETRRLLVELSIMADVGLVGFPNAGKSSLLDYFTNARPAIAPYPFTTKIPNLGVLRLAGDGPGEPDDIILADIPGIIEGASEGAGLGTAFLKHISRCRALLLLIDCGDDSCFGAYGTLLDEISRYDARIAAEGGESRLGEKKRLVLCNKLDLEGAEERAQKVAALVRERNPGEEVFNISIHRQRGLRAVQAAVAGLVAPREAVQGDKTGDFLRTRSVSDYREEQFPGVPPQDQGDGL